MILKCFAIFKLRLPSINIIVRKINDASPWIILLVNFETVYPNFPDIYFQTQK